MSLVIARVDGDRVLMGADSRTSVGENGMEVFRAEGERKILRMPGGVLIGAVGAVNVIQAMTDRSWLFEIMDGGTLDKRFLTGEVAPGLYRELKNRGWMKDDDIASMEAGFLFAQKNRLYVMRQDFSVFRVPSFAAIGCGKSAAFAVHCANEGLSARGEILAGLRLSARYHNAVGAPFYLADTRTMEFEEVRA